jgi:hypothetical protein
MNAPNALNERRLSPLIERRIAFDEAPPGAQETPALIYRGDEWGQSLRELYCGRMAAILFTLPV